jgi:methionine biosynthesis protein MetW
MIKALFREIRGIFYYRKTRIKRIDYDTYWGSRKSDVFEEGSSETERVISGIIDKDSTVLDMGCGDGRLLEKLAREKKTSGTGVDISEIAVRRARKRGVNAIVADVNNYTVRKSYDYITICDVLEHVPFPEGIMKNVKGKFNRNLIITIPNMGIVWNRLRFLFGKFPNDWYWHPAEHLRHWTLADIKWWLGENGYKIRRIYPHVGIPVLKNVYPSLFAAGFVIVLE